MVHAVFGGGAGDARRRVQRRVGEVRTLGVQVGASVAGLADDRRRRQVDLRRGARTNSMVSMVSTASMLSPIAAHPRVHRFARRKFEQPIFFGFGRIVVFVTNRASKSPRSIAIHAQHHGPVLMTRRADTEREGSQHRHKVPSNIKRRPAHAARGRLFSSWPIMSPFLAQKMNLLIWKSG